MIYKALHLIVVLLALPLGGPAPRTHANQPSPPAQTRKWRRARKTQQPALPVLEDRRIRSYWPLSLWSELIEARQSGATEAAGVELAGWQQQSVILDSDFLIHSRDFVFTVFVLPQGTTLTGRWSVKSKDLEVLVIDADGLDAFRDGGSYRFYYDSRASGDDSVSVPLPPGKFAVVFNNRYSVLTSKSAYCHLEAQQ